MERTLKIGDPIVYVDAYRTRHNALVTRVWGSSPGGGGQPGCNLLWVSGDDTKTDPYGRQIERATSVVHLSGQPAGAFCWCWPDEVPAE